MLRLTSARARGSLGAAFDALIDRVSAELDAARSKAGGLRGAARQRAGRAAVGARPRAAAAGAERRWTTADARIAGARRRRGARGVPSRHGAEAFARAREAAIDRLVRERFGLPTIAFEYDRTVTDGSDARDAVAGQTVPRRDREAGRRRPDDRARRRPGRAGRRRDSRRARAGARRAGRQGRRLCADAVGGRAVRRSARSVCRSAVRRLPVRHIAYPRQLELKAQVIADAFGRIGRLALPAPRGRRRLARGRLPDARAPARARPSARLLPRGQPRGVRRARDAAAAAGDLRRARSR